MAGLRDLVRIETKRGIELPAWLERIASYGIVTDDPEIARRQRMTNIGAFALAANALSHLVILMAYDFAGLVFVHLYNIFLAAAMLAAPLLHRFGRHAAATAIASVALIAHPFVVWMLGVTSDLHIYFTMAGAMLFAFGVQNWRLFLAFFVLFLGMLLFVLNFAPADGMVLPEGGRLRDLLSNHALINTAVINAALIFYALSALKRAETELETEHERSEALLAAVMPAAIAQRLKASGGERIADRMDNLCVMFADLVEFTRAARDLPPEAVVAYLDDLVRRFDEICARHGVDKIKTIGDSYMAVAGLAGSTPQDAVAIGRCALEMLTASAERPPLGAERLALRIGLHCGPATAGVIGETRVSYDVWGDAVNIAARMESHGVAGRIQTSEAFRECAGEAFVFEERGATEIKSVGVARTTFSFAKQGWTRAPRVKRRRPERLYCPASLAACSAAVCASSTVFRASGCGIETML
jgi:adenylate cyclase